MSIVTRVAASALLLATALAGHLLVSQSASAAVPGRTVVFAASAADSTDRKTVRAFCPSGTVVVGGGGALQATGREVVKFRTASPFQSVADGRTGYTVIAEELRPFSGNWSVAARAICAPRPAGWEIKSVTIASNSNSPKSAQVLCSAGRRPLAPGASVRGPSTVTPQVTLNGFMVNGARTGAFAIGTEVVAGFSGNWDMIVTVVCANQPAGYTLVENQVASGGQADTGVQATCPAGTTVHGVGGLIIASTAGDTHLYSLTSIEPTFSQARAHRSTPGQSNTWHLRTQAVCAS
jgi:hypothetical protein